MMVHILLSSTLNNEMIWWYETVKQIVKSGKLKDFNFLSVFQLLF